MEKVDHLVWLRNLENPTSSSNPFPLPSWPQPFYPELPGVDLYLADLKALETYISYFYYMSKMWAKPLPEVYDPLEVADYFSCGPHIVALRLLEKPDCAVFDMIFMFRKRLHLASKSESSVDYSSNGPASVFVAANLVLRLILSKDGVVLRRLLMTADGASLVQAVVCREAISFRQQLCGVITDVLYQLMCTTFGQTSSTNRYSSRVRMACEVETVLDYQSVLRDRRLKVIFLKVLKSTRRKPILMPRLSWVSFLMFLTASAMACHRMLVSLSEAYLGRLSLASQSLAVSA